MYRALAPARSLRPGWRVPQRLDLAAMALGLQSTPFRGEGRPCGDTPLWRGGGAAYQLDQPLARIGTVAGLTPVAGGLDDDGAILGPAAPGKATKTRLHGFRQIWRTRGLEAEVHRRLDLVHILPAGAGGPRKGLDKLPFLDGDIVGDVDHGMVR